MKPTDQALAKIMERLLVIEAKTDALLVHFGVAVGPMIDGVPCPACGQDITYVPDFESKTVIRKCGCGHRKFPPGVGIGEVIDIPQQRGSDEQGQHSVLRGRPEPDEAE